MSALWHKPTGKEAFVTEEAQRRNEERYGSRT